MGDSNQSNSETKDFLGPVLALYGLLVCELGRVT